MLNRKSMLQDLINKYGVTREDVVKKVVGEDPKDVEKGLNTLDLVIDYRDVNLETARKFAKATGATEDEVYASVADIELYRKTIKDDLDKERNEKIAQATTTIHAEMDEVVKEKIDNDVYQKGADWKKAQEAEKAAKAAAKKKKAEKTETTVESATEEVAASADPFED